MAKTTAVNQYEAMFLLGPIGAAEPENSLNLCRKVIESHGGEIIVIKKWDERKLAYEIGKQKRGTYVIAFFKAPGNAITPMERDVSLNESFLRAMFVRADHLNKDEMSAVEPQPIQPREERPWDRPSEGGGYGGGGDRGGDRGGRDDRSGGGGGGTGDARPPRTARPPRRDETPAEAGAAKD